MEKLCFRYATEKDTALILQFIKELAEYAKDNANIEARIKETQERLIWLEKIQEKVNSILEI